MRLAGPSRRRDRNAKLLGPKTKSAGDMIMRSAVFASLALALLSVASTAAAEQQWDTLPPTPTLPQGGYSGNAPVNGIKIWYADYSRGEPVILLHGGLANSNY